MPATLLQDNVRAIRNWRVWLHLGLADIRNRFARSIVGPLWIVLNLVMWVAGIGVIYAALFKQEIQHFLPFLTIGFVIWGYLTQTLTDGGNAFVYAEGYIKQFTYPKQIYVLRVLVNAAVPMAIGVVMFFITMLIFSQPMGWGMLWALPGFFVLAVTSYLHASIMAYASVRFRDLPYGMSSLLQVLFFVTPVFFSVEMLAARGLDYVYKFNPLWYLIEVVRQPMMTSAPADPAVYSSCLIYVAVLFVIALLTARVFDKRIVYML